MDQPLSNNSVASRKKMRWMKIGLAVAGVSCSFLMLQTLLSPSLSRNNIRTAQVQMGTIKATIQASGLVVPLSEETLSSELNSTIVKLFVQQGQIVKLGDPILQLDTLAENKKLSTIAENMNLKDSQIKSKRIILEKSLNDINAGLTLLRIDLESHQARLNRYQQLSTRGAVSQQELLEAQLNVKRGQVNIAQQLQSLTDLRRATDAEIISLDLEKSMLNQSYLEGQKKRNAALLRAKRSGIISWIHAQEGASVNVGDALAKIADNAQFKVVATLSDFYSAQLQSGMQAEITYNQQVIKGQLQSLAPTIENGVMKLIINLDETHSKLLHNQLRVDVGLITETLSDVTTVAKGPFVSGSGRHQIFVLQDNIAHQTNVEIGAANASSYQVVKGLKVGDEVIISDTSAYRHLQQIQVN